jgi:hypothetical protein
MTSRILPIEGTLIDLNLQRYYTYIRPFGTAAYLYNRTAVLIPLQTPYILL